MDAVLTRLKEDLTKVLGDNMLCLIHTGSRVRGEAVEESDYDILLVLSSVNSSVLEKVRRLFLDYPDVSAYLASKQEFDTLPHARATVDASTFGEAYRRNRAYATHKRRS